MRAHTIEKRVRFFVAIEGECEQSFVKWLQFLADERQIHIHLHSFPLGGGEFKSMLSKSVRLHKRHCKISGAYKERLLIVDADRLSIELAVLTARATPAGLEHILFSP